MGKDLAACRGIYESWRFRLTIGREKFAPRDTGFNQVELLDSPATGSIHGLTGIIQFAKRIACLSIIRPGRDDTTCPL